MVYGWILRVQEWLLPPVCLLCGARAGSVNLCASCRAELPYQTQACSGCALPLPAGDRCGACLRRPPPVDEAVGVFAYRAPVDTLIQRLKFGRELSCARLLGHLMAERIAALTPVPDLIVPVPLHRARLAQRGFNQALELARPIAARLGAALDVHSCERVRATRAQSDLAAAERRRNVSGAFRAADELAGRHIAIVDDVMTTGYTVAALARALRSSGVGRVSVWVCARAAPGRSS